MNPLLPDSFDEFVGRASGPAKCGHDGCDKSGDFVIQIKIWAKEYSKSSTPLVMFMDIRRCLEHCWKATPDTFFIKESRDRIGGALRALGRAEPDFDNGEISWVKAATALGGGLNVS